MSNRIWTFLFCLSLACGACSPQSESLADPPTKRPYLDKSALFSGQTANAPFPTSAFAPGETAQPVNQLNGRLSLDSGSAETHMEILFDLFETNGTGEMRLDALPAISLELIQDGPNLIPLQRGRQNSEHPYWEWVFEPGLAWDEPGDQGWTRAALPFALLQRNANCTHNGVMTFLFKSDGSTSPGVFQLGSETCYYLKFNFWGSVPLYVEPEDHAEMNRTERAHIIKEFREERRARLPEKPLSALAEDYPGADPEQFLIHDIDEVSTYGFVIDGVHYSGGCPTRFGPFPFCEVLDLPSYSLAKTLVGSTVLMQLEHHYPGAKGVLVSDYVPECADDARWNGVTLEHLLDMSSGNYLSTVDQEDEFMSYEGALFSQADHSAKITYACNAFPRKSEPGTQWVYHTTDTYIAGTLMNAFWREQSGQDMDFYDDLLVDRILEPLAFSPTMQDTLRSYDEQAQPFTGYGLTLIPDDIARYAQFLMSSDGKVDGQQVLDPHLLAATLQQDDSDPGMTIENDSLRYNNGLWAANLLPKEDCPYDTWIPFMSGYGGISVAMLPNNTIYYVFSDNAHFKWAQAAIESNRIKPFCENPDHDL